MEGDEVVECIDARINGFCVPCPSRVLAIRPGIFRAKNSKNRLPFRVRDHMSGTVADFKMTPFGPQGLTQLRTYCP